MCLNKMFRKKGQGLSMNVVIIAALAVLVLIVLALVMTGKFRVFGTTTRDCSTLGGECVEYDDMIKDPFLKCPENMVYTRGTNCEDSEPKEYCCIFITEKTTSEERGEEGQEETTS